MTVRTSATSRSKIGVPASPTSGVVRASVGRDAEIRTLSIGFGADLSRVENEVVLAEPGGFSEQLGVFFADGSISISTIARSRIT